MGLRTGTMPGLAHWAAGGCLCQEYAPRPSQQDAPDYVKRVCLAPHPIEVDLPLAP